MNPMDQSFGRRLRSILVARPRPDARRDIPAALGATDAELVRLAGRPTAADFARHRALVSVYGGAYRA